MIVTCCVWITTHARLARHANQMVSLSGVIAHSVKMEDSVMKV